MDKETVVYIHNGVLLSYKRNTFESVLMDKSRAYYVQSEISWKEKNKYRLSTHVYGI